MFNRGWGARLKDLGQDLTNIEVNTILADGMTGRKMPPYPEALYDIADRYADYLVGKVGLDLIDFVNQARALEEGRAPSGVTASADLRPVFPKDTALSKLTDVPEALKNGWQDFRRLRWAANAVINLQKRNPPLDDPLSPETLTIVSRIHRNCGQLEMIVRRLQDDGENAKLIGVDDRSLYGELNEAKTPLPEASAVDLTRIRKIWELGVDRIVLQSVLQLDGDIVFRADKSLDLKARESLVKAHREFVELGVNHWRAMFELLANLMGSVFDRLIPGR
ncbi:MAG: hypothetical protein AAFX92_12300 [Pseudomonadota bacterium]